MFLRNLYRTSIKLNIRNYTGNSTLKKPPKILITGKFLCLCLKSEMERNKLKVNKEDEISL